ncbi:M56 family metallopeptidase [Mycolicibacterium mucogenicum]|uniref:Peptidase M48 domain-containing protein n=1 Tax=Mycolicibacterium aubagnense TaxID=319707 RepID=A0ABM7IMW2_9MYCO|nr:MULTISPECIES: M56 family metallopeptidase [Mycolicibacterium]RUP29178.1 MAG: M56 family peptidase [Mycolicibacterium sp.]MCX8557071.1 M56 family metallopeptidase [Mycolicibacterium mucogenicum]MCX8564741.1 M56 family metallopeptidase [Mycolicibacterium mucogenicum]TLH62752.1 M56 family peptidase [Mycolicibacterium aubagnense]BBX88136.1 hypothetical protein MAUB_63370 [Mycolicibacterium aubagnense]
MSTVVCLLGYSLVVLVLGPPVLRRLTASGPAPRLGVAAWLSAIVSVLATWAATTAIIAAQLIGHWGHLDRLIVMCLTWLCRAVSGGVSGVGQAVVGGVLAAAAVAAVVATIRLVRAVGVLRRRARQHAEDVRLVGRGTSDDGVVVIDVPRPAAYCVSGSPPAIVFTSGALDVLDERARAAVLAHERAHLAGHHLAVMTFLRAVARVFPGVALMAEGAQQVSRLLEMCADDAAARRHGGAALLSGLIALCGAAPAEALGAADVAVLDRAERLAGPRAPFGVATQIALVSAIVLAGLGPVMIGALAATGVSLCMG